MLSYFQVVMPHYILKLYCLFLRTGSLVGEVSFTSCEIQNLINLMKHN